MEDSQLVPLVDLGLTRYEAAAYLALIRRSRATGAEVARLAELPRQRIYDVLDSLAARGLVTVQPGRPARFTARPPQDAIELLLREHRLRLERLELDAARTAEELHPAYEAGRREDDPLRFIELLREPLTIARRFDELQAAAEQEILVFSKPPFAVDPEENLAGLELLGRGIAARGVYERSLYDDPRQVEAVAHFVEAGERARVVERLPLKLVVIDERVSLFTMEDPVAGSPGLTIMVVEHPALAQLLKLAFERVWEGGEEFSRSGTAPRADPVS